MNSNLFSSFTSLYPTSKTLRFELIPQGKTLDNIEQYGIITEGETKSKHYKIVKEILDEYHKYFIDKYLKEQKLDLSQYIIKRNAAGKNATDANKKAFVTLNKQLRTSIANMFKASEEFDKLFNKKNMKGHNSLILDKTWQKTPLSSAQIEAIESFNGFYTYFTGLNKNRKNMYNEKEHSTTIAYRIIHENLPKFADNLKIMSAIQTAPIPESQWNLLIEELQPELTELLRHPVSTLDEVFTIDTFNCTLTQRGIDLYNTIIGGKTDNNGKKIRGINEVLNTEYNQKVARNQRISKLRMLYKQILSDRESLSFLPVQFVDDNEMLETVNNAYRVMESEKVFTTLQRLIQSLNSFDTAHIYIPSGPALRTISQRLFGDYAQIDKLLEKHFISQHTGKKITKKIEADLKKFVDHGIHSIALLDRLTRTYASTLELIKTNSPLRDDKPVSSYFNTYSYTSNTETRELTSNTFAYTIEQRYAAIKGLLNTDIPRCEDIDEDIKTKIKQLLDSMIDLLHHCKTLKLPDDFIEETDLEFYSDFKHFYDLFTPITKVYDRVRNYLTRKPYSIEKIKLNFSSGRLLEGWSQSKESDYLSVMLQKDGKYYLAIMNSQVAKANKSFTKIPKATGEYYLKMDYNQPAGSVRQLPRLAQAASNRSKLKPSERILEILKTKSFFSNETDKNDLIAFYIANMSKIFSYDYTFKFKSPADYASVKDFCNDVDNQAYSIEWTSVPVNYIDKLIDKGKLFLFQIYNKDFSPFSKGKPNLHTLYWKALFSEENLKQHKCYKLNGKAEVFFRRRSINAKNIITHPKNQAIASKNLAHSGQFNTFDYELIKDKRFTVDKFLFHCPITLNYRTNPFNEKEVNLMAREAVAKSDKMHIIGIDRGERHLLYLNIIDLEGNIIHQESLNIIGQEDAPCPTNYHALLDEKQKSIHNARENWTTIENIKELKAGYLSQVVHKIAKLMIQYNAIVVLEDLNFGFKKGRFKVEKQVYQKFEKALIDKLNLLVFKEVETDQLGGLYSALQLTAKFESFQKLGKQTGFIFYVPAQNTSKIDPTTGFIDLLHPKYENLKQALDLLALFNGIRFNPDADYFEFDIDYSKFTDKQYGKKNCWTLCTHGAERYYYNGAKKQSELINVTEMIKTSLRSSQIEFESGHDLRHAITHAQSVPLSKDIIWALKLILAIRYSSASHNRDFILSPVKNKSGGFFNSEIADANFPRDADSNGAYHIALKGLILRNILINAQDIKKESLSITNNDWISFVQTRVGF